MSTCSDAGIGGVAQLLAGVATECSSIGSEIAQLGAAVSGSAGQRGASLNIVRLQSFDRLMQNAHAQACLIAHLARLLLTEQALDQRALSEAIDNVPLPEVRKRLREMLGHREETVETPDEEIW